MSASSTSTRVTTPTRRPCSTTGSRLCLEREISRAASSTSRLGLDRHRVLGHQVARQRRGRLAQAVLEVAQRLEEHEAAEQLEVVRQVQVGVLAGHDQVGLGDDADAAPARVDHRHAGQLVLAQDAQHGLDRVLGVAPSACRCP